LALIWEPQTPASQSWSLVNQKSSKMLKVFTFSKTKIILGARTTPSVVAFVDDGNRLVGDVAKRQVSRLDKSIGPDRQP